MVSRTDRNFLKCQLLQGQSGSKGVGAFLDQVQESSPGMHIIFLTEFIEFELTL